MREPMLLAAAALLAALPALAQTPAEQASRTLNQDIVRDRARDAAEDARDADTARATPAPVVSEAARLLEVDRATIRPDIGRPDESGITSGTRRTTGEDGNVNR